MRMHKAFWGMTVTLFFVLFLVALGVWHNRVIPRDRILKLEEDGSVVLDLSDGLSSRLVRDVVVDTLPRNGWVTGTSPRIEYHPRKDYYGSDQFQYRVTTCLGNHYSALVHLKISGKNDNPDTRDDEITVIEDHPEDLILHATDLDGDPLTYQILKKPLHGSVTGRLPHLIYTPDENYTGKDRLVFIARDRDSSSRSATVSFTITPRNDPPVAHPVAAVTHRGFPIYIKPDARDVDSSDIRYESIKKPRHGRLKKVGKGFQYQPNKRYIGRDSFTYRAYDGEAYSSPATVSVNVYPFKGADQLTRQLKKIIRKGGVAVGSSQRGGYIFQAGRYKPASIMKLATASAALHYLGGDAHFETEFFLDGYHNLYIKGYGDPSLTTAEWHEIARELMVLGVFDEPIPKIVLDDSAFGKDIDFSGRGRTINYFDAPLGALASNYNTAEVNIRSGHRVRPWKKHVPITDMVRRRARGLPKGYHRFSIASESENGTRYSGEFARAIFLEYGLKNRPIIDIGEVPYTLGPFYVHHSSDELQQIVKTMLWNSNNFIANQLLLTMAIDRYGEPARFKQGVDMLKQYLRREEGLHPNDFVVVEGSGLSHRNRIDVVAMLNILNQFSEYRKLMPPLTKSRYSDLIRIGRRWRIRAKTGTMKGIATLAGFLKKPDGQWLPFVIMLEGKPADRAAVLKIICRFYAGDGRRI